MSIYAGHRDVLITSYEGSVLIQDIPNNIKKNKLINIARLELQTKKEKPLVYLNNITYKANPNSHFDGIDPNIIVKYNDVK